MKGTASIIYMLCIFILCFAIINSMFVYFKLDVDKYLKTAIIIILMGTAVIMISIALNAITDEDIETIIEQEPRINIKFSSAKPTPDTPEEPEQKYSKKSTVEETPYTTFTTSIYATTATAHSSSIEKEEKTPTPSSTETPELTPESTPTCEVSEGTCEPSHTTDNGNGNGGMDFNDGID